jgi:hypothetical protein
MTSQVTASGAPRRDRATMLQVGLLALAFAIAGYSAVGPLAPAEARAQGPGGLSGGPGGPGGRGPMMAEQKIVDRFDTNRDGRLDAGERKTAREWLATSGTFRPRFGGGRGMASGSPGRKLAPADVRTYGDEPLYDLSTLRTIFLNFENGDWEQELGAFYRTDVEVPATAVVDGKTYKDVGVRFRGMSSFMMVPEGSKRSLNLSFDFVHDGQALNGYRTLNLLNANGDPSFVRPVLYSEIARPYIPIARANFVRVVINGESWGLYVNSQQFNRDFLRDHFETDRGARWKVPGSPGGRGGMEYLGEDIGAYRSIYEIRSKDDPKAWADLVRMFRVLNETSPERLEAVLSPLLDIDGALKFLALDIALVNSDGYWTRASDYNIYQDPQGRFHIIPHDTNEALMEGGGRGGRGGRGFGRGAPPGGPPPEGGPVMIPLPPGWTPPDGAPPMPPPPPGGARGFGGAPPSVELDPLVGLDDPTKPLRSKLLAVPALRERYLGYVRDIARNGLDWAKLEPKVRAWMDLIDEEVKLDTRKLYSYDAFRAALGTEGSLQSFVERRRRFLLNVTDPERRLP